MTPEDSSQSVAAAAALIGERWPDRPRLGMILGTGQGEALGEIDVEAALPYDAVPGFTRSTAVGHRGRLVCGRLCESPIVVMEGRCHWYEGTPAWRIAFPVRVMHALGVRLLVVTNAAGAVNPRFRVGDLMVIEDQINLMSANPLMGPAFGSSMERRPRTGSLYDPVLIDRACAIARQKGVACHRGVYVALSGPNYETRAEYRFVRMIGGDVVGMSTVPEVLVASQLGLRVFGLSTVTNVCRPDALDQTSGEDIVRAALAAQDKLGAILRGIAGEMISTARSSERECR
ncbi:MAG: purine-nucleoside phosphorylase [Planctomycetaceae bacterium]|nr:purine-nucleoside phosphorylase [Planctomycetaceae bacterium]